MPTTNTRYVDVDAAAGGDGTTNALTGANCAYKSLSIWEAARQADLVAGDIIEECICESSHANHTADTTAVTIDGWTTSATNYINIYTSATARHSGKWNDTKYRIVLNGFAAGTGLDIKEEYVRIDGLQIKYSDQYANYNAIRVTHNGAADTGISNTIVMANTGTYKGSGILSSGYYGYLTVWNSIISGFVSGITNNITSGYIRIYNTTLSGNTTGLTNTTGTATLKNVLFDSNTTDASGTIADTYSATTNDNTKGLTAAGTGNRFSQTFTFVTPGSDFHLQATDAGAKDYGVTDPGSGLFSDDIDGQTRSAPWDIGADEYVAADGLSISVADNVNSTESISELITALMPSVFANANVSESVTPKIVALIPSVFDTTNASESTTAAVQTYASVFDGVNASELASALIAALKPSVSDIVNVSEDATGLIDRLLPAPFDSVQASESTTGFLVQLAPSVFDAASVSEFTGVLIDALKPSLFDGVNAFESLSLNIGALDLSLSDNVNVGEGTAAFLLNLAPSVFDTIQASEVVGSLIDRLLPSVSDSATATELPFLLVGTLVPEVFDGVGVNESVAFSIITAGTTNVSVYNDVTVADACTLLIPTLIFLAQDGAFATDVPALLLPQLFTNVFDPVVVRDSASPRIPSALAARHRMMMGMGM